MFPRFVFFYLMLTQPSFLFFYGIVVKFENLHIDETWKTCINFTD